MTESFSTDSTVNSFPSRLRFHDCPTAIFAMRWSFGYGQQGCRRQTAHGADAKEWGNYYEHAPLVLAGHLPEALRRLGKRTA